MDCPSGACSFTAIGKERGFDVIACDIAYSVPVESLLKMGLQDVDHAMESMEDINETFLMI
ncbi:MAG: hypothetical protein ACQEWV_00345 [Bacillota bacterium]